MSAAPSDTDRGDLKSTTYEFFILAISIMSIITMAQGLVSGTLYLVVFLAS